MDKFNSPEYKRSRFAYSAQCAFEHFIGLIFGGSFLVKLLNTLGLSDAAIGIITSVSACAFLFQIIEIMLVNKIKNVKRTVMIWDTMSQLSFAIVYFIPFLKVSTGIKSALVVATIMFAYFSRYIITSCYYKWANAYVSPDKRATYSAVKEMISLFTGMIVSLLTAFVFDKFEISNNIMSGFLFLGITMIIINSCSFISYAFIKKPETLPDEKPKTYKPQDIIANTFLNRSFRNVIILTSLAQIGINFAGSFMGTFMQMDLGYTVFHVQIITILGHLFRLMVSMPLGKYSDKKSYAKGIEIALFIMVAAYVSSMFANNSRPWLSIVYIILTNGAQAGIYANFFNITYDFVEQDYIVPAMAIKNSLGGILGFLASVVGGMVLDLIQKNGNIVFGIKMYGQQFMSFISLIILISAIIFDRLVVEKQKSTKR